MNKLLATVAAVAVLSASTAFAQSIPVEAPSADTAVEAPASEKTHAPAKKHKAHKKAKHSKKAKKEAADAK